MLNGPNLEKITELTSNTLLPIIASGGVSSLEDLIQLKKIKGVSGVISGKALYENTFSLDEALNLIS
jgi:phosphoribosylformimino-5-aminoimidazole carboxamide ribonucleotide (ProFAR) isomerase